MADDVCAARAVLLVLPKAIKLSSEMKTDLASFQQYNYITSIVVIGRRN